MPRRGYGRFTAKHSLPVGKNPPGEVDYAPIVQQKAYGSF